MSFYVTFQSTCFCDRRFFSVTETFVGGKKKFFDRNCLSVTEMYLFDRNSDKNLFIGWKFVF